MNALAEFDTALRRHTGEADEARPFVCDGTPLDCEVFIVGCNPARSVPFWRFWSLPNGFDRLAWEREYLATKGRPSPTRRRIDRLRHALAPEWKCLESYVYPYPGAREKNLAKNLRSTEVIEFLLEAIRPKVVVLHGTIAVSVGEPLATRAGCHGRKMVRHLSLCGYTAVDAAANEIRQCLSGTPNARLERPGSTPTAQPRR